MEILFGKIKEYLKGVSDISTGSYPYLGENVDIEIDLDRFYNISNNSFISVEFTKDVVRPTLTVDKGLVDYIKQMEFIINKDELFIKEKNNLLLKSTNHTPTLKIPTQELKNLKISGTGNFITDNTVIGKIEIKGTGKIEVNNFTGSNLSSESTNDILINNIIAESVSISHKGIGDFLIQAGKIEQATIKATGTGNVNLNILMKEVNLTTSAIGDINLGVIENNLTIKGNQTGNISFQGPVKSVVDVDLSGIGNITGSNIDTDSIYIKSSGTGNVELLGKSKYSKIYCLGIGDVNLGDLLSTRVEIVNKGTGDTTVFVENMVDVNLAGIGDVNIFGDKSKLITNKEINGMGDVCFISKKRTKTQDVFVQENQILKNIEVLKDTTVIENNKELLSQDNNKATKKESIANKLRI